VAKDLTKLALDNLKPGAIRREVPDARTRGLYYVLQPSGVTSWAVRYRKDGRNKKLTIGRYPKIDLKTARQIAAKALAEIAAGGDPAAEKQIKKAALRTPADDLVDTAMEQFVRRHVRTLKSAGEAERLLRKEILKPWQGKRLSDITRRDVHSLLDGVLDRPAPVTDFAPIRSDAVIRHVAAYLKVHAPMIGREPVTMPRPLLGPGQMP
jgi:hypothetical protein